MCLQGITYYNTYYKWPLLFCATLTGLGWIVLLVLETNSIQKSRRINYFHRVLINIIFLAVAALSSAFIFGNYISIVLYILESRDYSTY